MYRSAVESADFVFQMIYRFSSLSFAVRACVCVCQHVSAQKSQVDAIFEFLMNFSRFVFFLSTFFVLQMNERFEDAIFRSMAFSLLFVHVSQFVVVVVVSVADKKISLKNMNFQCNLINSHVCYMHTYTSASHNIYILFSLYYYKC